jgi:predicted Rossmann fold flavoprotein
MKYFDVVIIGAGGAGMMCAIQAGKRYRSVALLDHSQKLGAKILISGGGRCNFTNTGASSKNYVSQNPHFCKSALARFPSENFVEMVQEHGIAFHEKKLGQLFCDGSAQNIVDLLKAECDAVGAEFKMGCVIHGITAHEVTADGADESSPRYQIETSLGAYTCHSLVIASGGLSIPKIGATGFGYNLAKQFGLRLVPRAAALDGFTLNETDARFAEGLSGISADSTISCNGIEFRENILFTHAGLSGPATLQASLHWYPGDEVMINLVPDVDVFTWLTKRRNEGSKSLVKNLISELVASRLAERWCELYFTGPADQPIATIADKDLKPLADKLNRWVFVPASTVGYNKAEVTRGGVDTDELSSKTMEARKAPGLYFIGEVVDVSGWLGGYNFQWAWASGAAAGSAV